MSPTRQAARTGRLSRALAADRLGVPAVLSFVLAGVAPLTVAAGVIPTAYATTGLTGIPAAFVVVALAAATAPWTGRFDVFDQALEDHHPADVTHQHLAILAVRPGCQGQGTGTGLLTARHVDLDRDGAPAYLEASSPRARDLYLRHGYTLRPDAPFRLPGGPPLWPMWREPAPARTASGEGRREPGRM
jgi:GNAT superfamily N-acetyltransferase